jgi:hypothetical protein
MAGPAVAFVHVSNTGMRWPHSALAECYLYDGPTVVLAGHAPTLCHAQCRHQRRVLVGVRVRENTRRDVDCAPVSVRLVDGAGAGDVEVVKDVEPAEDADVLGEVNVHAASFITRVEDAGLLHAATDPRGFALTIR